MNVDRLEYLKMIQEIITRMANNSFLLKGWAITLVSGIFALSAWNNLGVIFYCLIYIPLFVFWLLDSYYLQQERLYRGLYDRVRKMEQNHLDASKYSLCPPLKKDLKAVPPRTKDEPDYNRKKYLFHKVLLSKTECGLYLPLIVLVTIVIIFLAFNVGKA